MDRITVRLETPAAEIRLGRPLPGLVKLRDSAALGAFGLVFKPWQGRLGPFFLTLTETLADTAALTGCGTVLHTLKHLGTYRIDAPGEELDGGAALTAAGFIKEE